ncbi:FkbM family methyltransferase [Paramyrothecium foliicola]|nr:FkbM family methyltransferase [Paramyrothecium foliicola]
MATELMEFPQFSCYVSSKGEAEFIYKEIFEDHCYRTSGLPRDPVVIDVGANIGLFCLYIKQHYPLAKILAFEPAPQSFSVLQRNLDFHNAANVQVFPVGLAAKASTGKLTYFPVVPGNSTLVPEEKKELYKKVSRQRGQEVANRWFSNPQTVDVKLQRLSAYLNNDTSIDRVDLLKIDVEGAELDVLNGIDDMHWPLIQSIVLETWESSGIRLRIQHLLESKGFIVAYEEASWAPKEFFMVIAHRS